MIETFQEFLERLKSDLKRLAILLVFVVILSTIDDIFQFGDKYAFLTAVLTSTSIVLLATGFSHILRRILFPSVDMKIFAKKALEEPLAAAVVFFGICVVLSTVIAVNLKLMG